MELTDTEKMLLELLQEKDAEAQRQSQQRMMRFLSGVAERTGIPLDALGINPQTGIITDGRIIDPGPWDGTIGDTNGRESPKPIIETNPTRLKDEAATLDTVDVANP